ncbi:hypothetical protein [Streptomyces sp. NPDC057375]|uniref:hypothetical protein n=1 Tax=Streptomyces sp. NPDC057375 TaxID=3346109 RepID=UPI0036396868
MAHLEEGFTATLDNDVFGGEQESGVLCSLGEEVAEALAFLESPDFQEALRAHQSDMGHLLQVRGEAYLSRLEQLKRFYGLAAQEGQAVVKRVYGHY